MSSNWHIHPLLIVRACLLLALLCSVSVRADLAVPGWYTEAGVPGGWHYRVPLTLPAPTTVNSTVVADVDFHALLTTLGVNTAAVDFDESSVRVVRGNGTLATRQEFTDRVYGGVLDAAGNGRGEVRFIAQDTAAHFLYFDIVGNGAKPAAPGVTVINGHFEQSAGSTPTGWVVSSVNTGGDQNNEVYRTTLGSTINLAAGCSNNAANGLNTSPNSISGNATGEAWHLLGYRNNCEDGSGNERVRLSRDIAVPAGAAAGELEFYFQVQSFDGIANSTNYDWVTFNVNGSPVNHTALGIVNTGSPTLIIETGRLGRNNYGSSILDFGWKRARLNLSAYAGTTINFRIETWHSASDNSYRSWVKVDDVQWSRQNATLGAAQAFGANLISPADTGAGPATQYSSGQTLSLRTIADARATAVTADLYDNSGALVVSGIRMYNDGTHGDAVAGDLIWSNNGSVPADPTYSFLVADTPGPNWRVRTFVRDGSVSIGGLANGLLRIPGQPAAPQIQANYFNIDEQTFILAGARMQLTKTISTLQDPAGGSLPKDLPGSWLRYQVRVVNQGPSAADNNSVILVDEIPATVQMCVLPACTCVSPCTPVDPVAYDASASPIPTGLTYSYATHVTYSLDGVDYSYTPVPDGAGFDPAVRYVRVAPAGAMSAPGVPGQAEFTLSYVVRIE
ncbi:MAG: hypothetical protein R3E82_17925 [Pseudomonadales bacterium]